MRFFFFPRDSALQDRVFWAVFYLTLGLVVPFITYVGPRLLQIPFFVVSAMIVACLVIAQDCRKKVHKEIFSVLSVLFLILVFLLILHVILSAPGNSEILRLVGKPVIVAMSFLLLTFVLAHRAEIDKAIVRQLFLYGVMAGVLAIGLQGLWNSYHIANANSLAAKIEMVRQIFRINRSMEVLSILAFLLGLAVSSRIAKFIVPLAVVLLLIVFNLNLEGSVFYKGKWYFTTQNSETLQFGIPIACAVFVFAMALPRIALHSVFAGAGGILLTAPWFFQGLYKFFIDIPLPHKSTFMTRFEIWDAVARKVLEAPFLGHGISALRYDLPLDISHTYMKTVPLHPHNMLLQLWLDLGIVAVLIFAGFLWLGWRWFSRVKNSQLPPLLASFTMLGIFLLATHSVWQTWSMALVIFSLVLMVMLCSRDDKMARATNSFDQSSSKRSL